MKKFIFLFFLLLSLTMLLPSCIKEEADPCSGVDCLIFGGYISDDVNGEPLKDVEVIGEHILATSLFSSSSTSLGRTSTNKDGIYRFTFDGTKFKTGEGYFRFDIQKEGFFDEQRLLTAIDSTNFDLPVVTNIQLIPKAPLKLAIKTSPVISSFEYQLSINQNTRTFTTFPPGEFSIDTTHRHIVPGDRNVQIIYSYKKHGDEYRDTTSVFVKRGELNKFLINVES